MSHLRLQLVFTARNEFIFMLLFKDVCIVVLTSFIQVNSTDRKCVQILVGLKHLKGNFVQKNFRHYKEMLGRIETNVHLPLKRTDHV